MSDFFLLFFRVEILNLKYQYDIFSVAINIVQTPAHTVPKLWLQSWPYSWLSSWLSS